mmetsp:Transcript_27150/g.38195  ORF Transcript_27150/g.38195 Transcript_27150/m.38195 type:complete len:319 (-) Transcript_27150:324-1280(-)
MPKRARDAAAGNAHGGATNEQLKTRTISLNPPVPVAQPQQPPLSTGTDQAAAFTMAHMASQNAASATKNEEKPKIILQPMLEAYVPLTWFAKYEELKEYKKFNGDTNVPSNPRYKELNNWKQTQKQQYRLLHEGKPNRMSHLRMQLLNQLGFEWSGEPGIRDKNWNDKYAQLVAFHKKTGTTRVPETYDVAPQLHGWLAGQRKQLKLSKEGKPTRLTQERVNLLKAVGLECEIRKVTTWMDRFNELKRYKEENGDCNVPQKWKENPSLGRWVDNQKTQHQKLFDGKPTHLTIERIQLLVGLGFNWRGIDTDKKNNIHN